MSIAAPERPPRWATPRRIERRTLGPVFDELASVLGVMLFLWQRLAADVALEIDPRTKALRYRTVGISVARQNGKTLLVIIRIAMELVRSRHTVVYTAQDRNYARRQWEKHCDWLMAIPAFACEVREYTKAHGRETLKMRNGSEYLIVTPNEDAGRSLTVDLAVIDEAYAQRSMDLIGALTPTMVTRPSAQLWVLSNAGTFGSVLFRHYTEVGREAVDDDRSRLCWLEWATDIEADLLDPSSWADANPALGLPGGPLPDALESDLLDIGEDRFRREHLNQWLDLGSLAGIDAIAWAACFDPTPPPVEVVLGLDITPERDRGSLVAAGSLGGARTAFEVIEHTADLQRLVARAAEVANDHAAPLILDRASPAGACIPALEAAGVQIAMIPMPELARACGEFHDAVIAHLIAQPGDPRLSDAVLGASKRRVGDGWVWNRRAGVDISALIAATLARWGVLSGVTDPAIY
jgi:phage terminase large subunit-like protein